MMAMEQEYISQAEAQRRYGIGYRILQRWIRTGEVKTYERAAGSRPMLRAEEVARAARIVPANEGERK